MQILTREVGAYLNLYSYEREQSITVRTAAKLMGSMLFERRYFPYLAQTIVGGIDEAGPKLFVLDPLGSADRRQVHRRRLGVGDCNGPPRNRVQGRHGH